VTIAPRRPTRGSSVPSRSAPCGEWSGNAARSRGAVRRMWHGYPADEAFSAIQKCIRRGQSDEALFWTTEANVSGLGAWVWRRLFVGYRVASMGPTDRRATL
jgi:hypothetical protein